MDEPISIQYGGVKKLVPFDRTMAVPTFKELCARALNLNGVDEIRLWVDSTELTDDKAMLEFGIKPSTTTIVVTARTSLATVFGNAADIVKAHSTKALFAVAIPLVLYVGLRRRGYAAKALLDVLRLPCVD